MEDWAWRYLAMTELQVRLCSVAAFAFGGICAALFLRGDARISRGTYFALTGGVTLFVVLGQTIWLAAGGAMQGGWLWVVVVVEWAISFVAGGLGVAAGQARSRDLMGHGRAGILGIVPLANLWLIFTQGEGAHAEGRRLRALQGVTGVLFGLVAITGSRGLEGAIGREVVAEMTRVAEDPAVAPRMVAASVARDGLAAVLQQSAAGVTTPVDLGDGTVLQEARAQQNVLRYTYDLGDPASEMNPDAQAELAAISCDNAAMRVLLGKGAVLEFAYRTGDINLGMVTVTIRDCSI